MHSLIVPFSWCIILAQPNILFVPHIKCLQVIFMSSYLKSRLNLGVVGCLQKDSNFSYPLLCQVILQHFHQEVGSVCTPLEFELVCDFMWAINISEVCCTSSESKYQDLFVSIFLSVLLLLNQEQPGLVCRIRALWPSHPCSTRQQSTAIKWACGLRSSASLPKLPVDHRGTE